MNRKRNGFHQRISYLLRTLHIADVYNKYTSCELCNTRTIQHSNTNTKLKISCASSLPHIEEFPIDPIWRTFVHNKENMCRNKSNVF